MESLVRRAITASLASVTVHIGSQTLHADASDQSSAAGPGVPTLSVNDLSSISVTWNAQVTEKILPVVADVFTRGAGAIAKSVERQSVVNSLSAIPATLTEHYLAQSASRLSNVADHVWETAKNQLLDGVQAGESIEQLSQRIHDTAGLTEARATRVARTEVVGAANMGAHSQVVALGFTGTKTWLATNDGRTRETHRDADGQRVNITAPFIVGDFPLDAPGDPSGPPGEVIDCRCTQIYDLDDGETQAMTDDSLVAADTPYTDDAGVHTGAMIALVPTLDDAQRLVLDGGEPVDELHLTLFYLGDAVNTDESTQARITATIVDICQLQPIVAATGFGVALWNPSSDEPAVVMNVGGCDNALESVREVVEEALYDVWTSRLPSQHEPWVPHVCLAYSGDPGLVATALGRVGPITFDRVRVAWGEVVTDVPLYGTGSIVAAATEDTVTAPTDTQPTEAPAADPNIVPLAGDGTPWEGVLVVEGIETGDGRVFAEGSLTWDTPPLALRWTPTDIGEHGGAVTSGRIDNVWRDAQNPTIIRGSGVFDSSGVNGAETERLVRGGFLKGVSVDVDSVKDADVELVYPADSEGDSVSEEDNGDILMLFGPPPEKMIFHAGRIRAATMVDIPAFVEAQIWLTDGTMELATSSPSATGQGYSVDNVIPHGCGENVNLTACAVGVNAILSDARLGMNMAQRAEAYAHLSQHLKAAGLTPQPFESTSFSEEVEALSAGLVPVDEEAPPAAWFTDPGLDGPTPLTITADGRIFGHGAVFGTCHTGFGDACVTPPRESEHSYFRQGEIVTAEGERIAVGQITLGTGHAPTFGINPQKAVEHYDNTGTVVADVVSGEDEYGIWVSGALRPGLSAARLRELRGAKLSGDWRRIGGNLRLVAFLAVNTPGFPVPRLRTEVKDGRQLSLVASGVMTATTVRSDGEREAFNQLRRKLQEKMGLTPAQRAAALRAKILGGS